MAAQRLARGGKLQRLPASLALLIDQWPQRRTDMKAPTTKRKSSGAAKSNTEELAQAAAPDRLDCIAAAAYYKAERRGFTAGREMEDWLEAESEFDTLAKH